MSLPEFNGYRVLTLKFNEASQTEHYLYVKEHSVREKCVEKPEDRTLFVLGIPPYATEDSLKNVFSTFGAVKEIYFSSKPSSSSPFINESKFFKDYADVKGFKIAYVVFETFLGSTSALSLTCDSSFVLSTLSNPFHTGIQKWVREYNEKIIIPDDILSEINLYMEEYDRRVEGERKRLKQVQEEPDEEGWLTVSRKGRRPGFSRKESVGKKIMAKEKIKRSKKQLHNFYRFQIKESKMSHLESLRKKFEEDKKKIALLKQSRKFRPY